jgi:hypothetical protein
MIAQAPEGAPIVPFSTTVQLLAEQGRALPQHLRRPWNPLDPGCSGAKAITDFSFAGATGRAFALDVWTMC